MVAFASATYIAGGMCLICRDGQGDFLGQIGATKASGGLKADCSVGRAGFTSSRCNSQRKDPDELRQEAERCQEGKEVKEWYFDGTDVANVCK